MTAADLLQRARGLGLQLEPRAGGGLAVRPASKLPSELADELRRHKTEVLVLLTTTAVKSASPKKAGRKDCRFGTTPPEGLSGFKFPLSGFNGGRPQGPPTTARRDLVIAYLTRQCDDRQLREWLTQRKAHYFATIGMNWDSALLNYAAARDAACWQLNRTEAQVWELLEGIESCLADLKLNLPA